MKNLPYLVFRGNAEEAFNYYKEVFGGKLELMPYSQMPGIEKMNLSEEMLKKVMHVSLKQGDHAILMGTDSIAGMGPKFTYGDSFFVSSHPDSEKDARKVFDSLSKDGKLMRPLEKQSWGDLFGMCTDKYGTHWMITYAEPK